MPVTFRVLPDRGLVYVRYEGVALMAEGFDAFAAYMRHPDCRPGQKQLVDLSAVTKIDRNFAQIMALQAFKADQFAGRSPETLLVYLAPHPTAAELARLSIRSWEGVGHIVARVMEDEALALTFLGQPEERITDLLARAA
jgi:hypothetical protein